MQEKSVTTAFVLYCDAKHSDVLQGSRMFFVSYFFHFFSGEKCMALLTKFKMVCHIRYGFDIFLAVINDLRAQCY